MMLPAPASLALLIPLMGCGAQALQEGPEPAAAMDARQDARPSPASERLIADFEHDSATAGWRVTDGDVQLGPSGDRATRGQRSLRITYGTAGFRIPRLDLERVGAADWQGWDTFEFDIYNAHPEPVSLRVGLFGGGSTIHSHNVTVPPGEWHRYRMSARRFEGHAPGTVDRARIDGFTVMGHPNYLQEQEPVTIYLDNIRLTNRSGERIAALRGLLDGLDGAGRGGPDGGQLTDGGPLTGGYPPADGATLSGPPNDADVSAASPDAIVRDVDGALRRLAPATTTARGREADSLAVRVSELEQTLAEALQARMVEHLALTSRIAAPVPSVREPGVPAAIFPLRASTSSTAQLRYDDAVGALVDADRVLEDLLAAARLDAAIERSYAGAAFAVGIPEVPTAWRDRAYTGEVGREVRLSAARHEFEPFQLVILPRGTRLDDVRVEASALVGVGAGPSVGAVPGAGAGTGDGDAPHVIAAEHVVVAPMGWRHELDGSAIADMIRTDVRSFSVEADTHQPVWGTVYVPEGTPPGEYRGTITVRATGVEPVEIALHLTVWDFTLPRFSTLETATWDAHALAAARSGRHDEHARMVIQHRWNANYLYLWEDGPLPLETMQRFTEQGSTLHNLIRVSRNFLRFEEGPDGLLRARADRRDWFFRRLDPVIEQIRNEDPDFLRHLMLYGFDEPEAAELPAMNRLYGEFKERYGQEITTAFATMHDYWVTHPDLENVDVWAVLLSRLTPEVVEDLHAKGHRVWWYNIYARQDDPVRTRVQFWGTFKDGIDGVLHYNLRQAGDGTNPSVPWGDTLWPDGTRTDGGVKRVTLDDRPISTVAFDYWREGMEDVEYLALLRDAADALRARVEAEGSDLQPSYEVRALLREADAMVRVPEHITLGVLGGGSREVGEVIVDLGGHTEDMRVVMEARRRIADLIVRVQQELAPS